jgi:hypothetical protein
MTAHLEDLRPDAQVSDLAGKAAVSILCITSSRWGVHHHREVEG